MERVDAEEKADEDRTEANVDDEEKIERRVVAAVGGVGSVETVLSLFGLFLSDLSPHSLFHSHYSRSRSHFHFHSHSDTAVAVDIYC